MEANTTFKEWMVRAEFSDDTERLKMEEFTRPSRVGKVKTPESLDEMTIGQMVEMSNCKNGREMFYSVCRVLLGMDDAKTDGCRAVEVVRFVGWVLGQVKVINELFDRAKIKPTSEELRAGIEKLHFGIFGMIDWYALRMGITDHEEVMSVPWGRVYKCLDMDTKKREFEKRLVKVYQDEHRK